MEKAETTVCCSKLHLGINEMTYKEHLVHYLKRRIYSINICSIFPGKGKMGGWKNVLINKYVLEL